VTGGRVEAEVALVFNHSPTADDLCEEVRVQAESLPTAQLVRIAHLARERGFHIRFTGLEKRALTDLMKIAAAGGSWAGQHRLA
jgi:hypothetical protein